MASINDVAKLAKVSKSTVSLVINNTGYVSETTKEKVLKAIQELNYVPNKLAQGLSKQHSGTIAIVVPDLLHPYFATLVKSVELELAKKEYMTIVCSAKGNENIEEWYIDMLNRKIVDGIITAGHSIDLKAYQISKRPIVSIDRFIHEAVPIVRADHEQAAKMASELLEKTECKQIVQFVGTENISVQSDIFNQELKKRLQGKGISISSFYIGHNTFTYAEYIRAAERLFEEKQEVDCIVGVDQVIAACMQIARKKNRSIQKDLKLLAYDGTYFTRMYTPVISALVQPIEKIGTCAAELIIKLIKEEKLSNYQYVFPVTFQKGETL